MSCASTQAISTINEKVRNESFEKNRWGYAHYCVWYGLNRTKSPISSIIESIAKYIDDYHKKYQSPIGHDRIIGDEGVKKMLNGIISLLNGELDGLDAGTCDQIVRKIAEIGEIDLEE